tara:strand:+ start:979 stop:1521 length:543 start_codon:yes stop_codon:yes gene_type:complete
MSSELRVDKIIPTSGVPTGGGGGIVQVITRAPNSGSNNTFTTTSTSLQHVSNMDTTITPIAANSKLLITARVSSQNTHGSNTNGRHQVDLRRSIAGGSDSSTLQQSFLGLFGYNSGNNDQNNYMVHSFNLLDSPSYSLGQSIVYKFYAASDTSSNTLYMRMDSGNNVGPNTVITIMEISA